MTVTTPLRFATDDLSGEPTRALIARHLAGMHASSPPESVHALDIEKLRAPGVGPFEGYIDDPFSVFMTRLI